MPGCWLGQLRHGGVWGCMGTQECDSDFGHNLAFGTLWEGVAEKWGVGLGTGVWRYIHTPPHPSKGTQSYTFFATAETTCINKNARQA